MEINTRRFRNCSIEYRRTFIISRSKRDSDILSRIETATFVVLSMNETHDCPICGNPTAHMERYPLEVCGDCGSRTCDESGRRVNYIVISLFGGLVATYEDCSRYPERYCWIDGIRCEASEHRFGGVVIERIAEGES